MDSSCTAPTVESPITQILREAMELIRDPDKWTVGVMARNKYGHEILVLSENAVRWCSQGAIKRVSREHGHREDASVALDSSAQALFGHIATWVNDEKDHQAVMRVFEFAIHTSLL